MSFYVIDHIEQGTSEWLKWRKGVIGASDAPVIMGENPWKSSRRLIEEKLGLHREWGGNAATREGQRLEVVARNEIAKVFNKRLIPTIVQDSHAPHLAASLDAIDTGYSQIFEIKAGVKAYEVASRTGKVPNYYVGQLQHMMMVTELESLIFAAYRPSVPLIILEIPRDEEYINRLRIKVTAFIQELSSRGHPIQKKFVGNLVSETKLGEPSSVAKSAPLRSWRDLWKASPQTPGVPDDQ
jgi:putative phage-type endonuclease